MIVGMARAELELPAGGTLKDKRRVVKGIVARIRHKFEVACAEVARLDDHHRATLGIAVVANDSGHVSSVLARVESFLAAAQDALLLDYDTQTTRLTGDH